MLDLIKRCNDADFGRLYGFAVDGKHVGYVRPQLANKLLHNAPELFVKTGANMLQLAAGGLSPRQITDRFIALHERMAADGILPHPANESTDVRAQITDEPLFAINRNLIFPLGIKSWGVHVIMTYENGDFVVARRSNKVFTFRGCYDVPVGGLLPSGADPWDHVKIEMAAESGLAPDVIKPGSEASVLAYARNVQGQHVDNAYKPAFPFETDGGTNWDEVFYWSTTLGNDVVPKPRDGEVKSFHRMTPEELIRSLKTEPDSWKTNSGVMFLAVLAKDSRYSLHFTDEDRRDIQKLLIRDPRPTENRGELNTSTRNSPPTPSKQLHNDKA